MGNYTENQPNIIEADNKACKKPRNNKALTAALLALSLVACEKPDEIDSNINIPKKEITIEKPERIQVKDNQVYLGDAYNPVATCTDNVAIDNVSLIVDGKTTTNTIIDKSGRTNVTIRAYDTSHNSAEKTLQIILEKNESPNIIRKYLDTPNVIGLVVVNIENNQLIFGNTVIYEGSDDKTPICTTSFTIDGNTVNSGNTINLTNGLHKGIFTLSDGQSEPTVVNFDIICEDIDLSYLDNNMRVDQEIDLIKNIPNGINVTKVEIKIDGQKQEIPQNNWHNYKPTLSGECNIYITWNGEFGNNGIKETSLSIKGPEYHSIQINNIKPVDILPVIGQVEAGDKECYSHIEHLRIAEATRIRDMMWKYGAGNHSPEEYQELMMRLNTGMLEEYPQGYNNFDILEGGVFRDEGSNHAHADAERSILNSLLNHTNLKVLFSSIDENHRGYGRRDKLETFINNNPESIVILGCSSYAEVNKEKFNKWGENNKVRELCESGKVIIFKSGGNIRTKDGILINKSYQMNVDGDEHGIYSLQSNANGKNDIDTNRTLFVSVGTNAVGDIDQTNEIISSSRAVIGFHNKVLFAGRAFPHHDIETGKIVAQGSPYNHGKYNTSFTNYYNVAVTDLCFQMFAEVKDVDELLAMVRSTCDTDYIRFDLNGDGDTNDTIDNQPETQPLQLINPAKFFKKYGMPKDIPSSITPGETIALNKGYYKGVAFAIPGAEVKINGQWVEYNKEHETLIKSKNPFELNEWRLNGDLVSRYSKNGSVTGKIIAVDDERNGLNLEKENIQINVKNNTQNNTSQYIASNYAKSNSAYGQGSYGKTLSGYGGKSSNYGGKSSNYGKGNYGETLPGYGQGSYGKTLSGYGGKSSNYGGNSSNYGKGNYGKTLPGYGENAEPNDKNKLA